VNYANLLEMNSYFTLHCFLEVGKPQDLPSKFWQTPGDALRGLGRVASCHSDRSLDNSELFVSGMFYLPQLSVYGIS
jgi:hypothetical protein